MYRELIVKYNFKYMVITESEIYNNLFYKM